MSVPRLLGLFVLLLTVAAVSAQQGLPPGVKLPPQIKPGMPPMKPGPKPGDPGKGKNPMPKPGDPKLPPGIPGVPPVIIPGSASPDKKKDDIKWPKEVFGKSVEVVVKEMRTHSDPGLREAAVRMLPQFGPRGREVGGSELVEVMTRDPDWNVRLAGLSVAPTVLFGYATIIDAPLTSGSNAMMNMLDSSYMHVKYDAVLAAAATGPLIRLASGGKVIHSLTSRSRESTSWHMRKAAAAALGAVGQGMPKGEDPAERDPPDQGAVSTLLDMLRTDRCAVVRRTAVDSLISLGPVAPEQQKKWRSDLDYVLAREKDKSVVLWTRTCILANDPKGVEGNEAHLNAVALVLQAPEPGGRLEACQALGLLADDAKGKLQDLLNLIQNPKEEPAIVAAGIMAVAGMKSQAKIILPILDNMKVTHPNQDVKMVATEASDILSGRKKN
jgi:hypothetical protein